MTHRQVFCARAMAIQFWSQSDLSKVNFLVRPSEGWDGINKVLMTRVAATEQHGGEQVPGFTKRSHYDPLWTFTNLMAWAGCRICTGFISMLAGMMFEMTHGHWHPHLVHDHLRLGFRAFHGCQHFDPDLIPGSRNDPSCPDILRVRWKIDSTAV